MRALEKEILQFEIFSEFPELVHGINTRIGGVSGGVYESLNLGMGLADNTENVKENYRIFCSKLGIPMEALTFSDQVHKAKVARIKAADRGNGWGFEKKKELLGVDALITKERGIALVISSADCVPILFYDPVQQVIAAAHSGWRGTLKGIAEEVVKIFQVEFGTKVTDLRVGLGPCIGKDSFEVGEDVKKEFENKGKYDILKRVIVKKSEKKYLLDLRQYISDSLQSLGLKKEQIEASTECTYSDAERFFSHRRCGLERGSHSMVIYLKESF